MKSGAGYPVAGAVAEGVAEGVVEVTAAVEAFVVGVPVQNFW